ncbi:MAG TPA: ATP-binding protein [Spirochaetota bacterium]|nr:GAF domain-containing protein [Spirochaetota bacterium]HOD13807.1 ATP-binding protein [Spirochaetota bacterium]HPG50144.1 ATP-binding protein [Spirochaetota bacterium]HPN11577.1 ATP-binding protein [Spirochaetota bacterium]
MTFLAVTGLLNFLGNAFLGTLVFVKNPRTLINRRFFYISAGIAIYSTGYFFWQTSTTPADALVWFMILFTGIVLINVTFLFYVFTMIGVLNNKKKELIVHCIISAAFIAMNFSSMLYDGLEPRFDLGFWPVPLPLFSVYLAYWTFQLVYGFILMLVSLNRTSGRTREQIKYTIASGIIGFIGGASNWPMWYGIYLPPYANILILVYPAVMAYAIVRYRLMEIRVVLTRTGLVIFIYALVLGVPFIIGMRTGFNFLAFLAMFILATLGPLIYRYLQKKTDSMLLARQREYQRILHESAVTLLREHEIDHLMRLVIYGMMRIIKVEYAGIFLENRENGDYTLKTASSYDIFPEGSSFGSNHPVIRAVSARQYPVTHEDISGLAADDPLTTMHLVVPSFIDGRLLGFLVLGEKKSGLIYSEDDLRTLHILSHQAALAVENCMFSEERKRTQERLYHTEKLAFIGGMAEGLAHQMRNRLNHFSIATRQMQIEVNDFAARNHDLINGNIQLKDLVESLGEIGDSIIDNVKRTNGVIQGVLNFTLSKDKNSYFSELSFMEILDGAVDLVKIKQGIEEFPITVEADLCATVYGVMTQIMESLYNIIDNGYEAMDEKSAVLKSPDDRKNYVPRILVRMKQLADASLIEITDNGIGISAEDQKKIFAPYFTTKSSYKSQSGSGIGLYVVQRMIEDNHRGKIWFTSESMKGTSFFIRLPVKGPLSGPAPERERP